MNHVRTLILGGGMSGLSCAYHLRSDYRLWEKSDEPGGLSRSIKKDGFVYDHTGHLLHLRDPYALKLIPKLLGDNLVSNERRAWIHSHGIQTRYPYQANLYGLPKKVIRECLDGLLDAQLHPFKAPPGTETLRTWVKRSFGAGFGKHFFYPYNEKLWTVSPDVLTSEWMGPFVPKPPIAEIIEGAFTDQTRKYGYNATFLYPREGGIQTLAFAFAEGLSQIQLNTAVTAVDLERKQATNAAGETLSYEHLVTTLPLARFLALVNPLPATITETARQLRWTSVYNLNLGVQRPKISDAHWIYFPEKKFRFYRVGFPMNFSDKMTPPGCSSMYIEIAYTPGHPPNDAQVRRDCLKGLYKAGILNKNDKIISELVLHIPIAYVIFDKNRTPATHTLLSFLKGHNVHSIGRFGGWKYSYMEEAILEGKATAESIDG
jgi:protoporphyrinogen oxidase